MSEKIYIPNDDDQVREMIELYESGLSCSEIGAVYGINFQKVGCIFRKIKGFKARKRYQAVLDGKRKRLDRELLTELYVEQRLSSLKIAKMLGETQGWVYSNLVYYDIPTRPNENYTTSELTPELLRRLFIDNKQTAQQIGNQLGFSVLTIRKRLAKFGIKKRKTQDSETKPQEGEWLTSPELSREFQIPLAVIWRMLRGGVFPNARKGDAYGVLYWQIPRGDIENHRSHLEALGRENILDPAAIIQFRYGYGADETLEIIEFERQQFTRDEIAAIFRIDRVLIDNLLDSVVSGATPPRAATTIKRFPKKLLIDLHINHKLPVEEILARLDTTRLAFYLSLKHWGIPLNHRPEKPAPPDPLTPRRKQMIELYESGLSFSEIGEKFGITPSTLWYNFKQAGYRTRRYTTSDRAKEAFRKRTTFIDKDKLESLYIGEKLSIKQVAEAVNQSWSRVRQNLIFHNIPIRPQKGHKSSKLTEKLLRRLFTKEKLTVREIAVRFDCSPKAVNRKLRKFGIRDAQNKNKI